MKTLVARMNDLESENDQLKADNERLEEKYNLLVEALGGLEVIEEGLRKTSEAIENC